MSSTHKEFASGYSVASRSMSSLGAVAYVGVAVLICSMHFALIIISALALALGSGGPIQIAAVVFSVTAIASTACRFLLPYISPNPDEMAARRRHICLFSLVFFSSCATFVVFVSRNKTKLSSDYAPVGDIVILLLALSGFSTLFALLLWVTHFNPTMTKYEEEEQVSERALEDRSRSPLPIVNMDSHGRWKHQSQQQQPEPEYVPHPEYDVPHASRQISADPFFDIRLYEQGRFPDGTAAKERNEWPTVEHRF